MVANLDTPEQLWKKMYYCGECHKKMIEVNKKRKKDFLKI